MKTISELQQEIRLVRKNLAKMDERLSEIDTELMSFKDSVQGDTNFKHIYNLAEAMPIIPHPVVTMQQQSKSIYFGILLMIATLEDSISEQQLLFLQRIVMTDVARNRIDYYMGRLGQIQPDNVIFCLDDEVILSHADQLLLDLIVIAKLGRNCTMKSFVMISDLASILKKNKADFAEITDVAAAVLKQDWSHLSKTPSVVVNFDSKYGHYLNELTGWKAYVEEIQVKKAITELVNVLSRKIGGAK
ncbi:hypothetical protein QUV93_04265 [Phascolarctobacterium faecium]|nr:hypothetical protein [Phascolarctobacterium faecium]MDM8109082.1 hypothetical protein [Phascolarctobacterium faecium]